VRAAVEVLAVGAYVGFVVYLAWSFWPRGGD
jgi:hypothetical protein